MDDPKFYYYLIGFAVLIIIRVAIHIRKTAKAEGTFTNAVSRKLDENDPQYYHKLFGRVLSRAVNAEMVADGHELFWVASQEQGFGWTKEQTAEHYKRTVSTGDLVELPNYVISFLDTALEKLSDQDWMK